MSKDNNININNVDFDSNNEDFKRAAISLMLKMIEIENRKPENIRDFALIDDCTKMVAELKGIKSELTKEEIAEKYRQAMAKTAAFKPAVKVRRLKRAFVVAAIVLIVILSGIALYAFNPTVHDWIGRMLNLPHGSVVEENDITYIHNDVVETYDSIDELLQALNLDILYPSDFLDDVTIDAVINTSNENTNGLAFSFTDDNYFYYIDLSGQELIIPEPSTAYQKHEVTFYIRDSLCDAIFQYNGNIYTLSAPNNLSLIYMIDNLKGIQ